MLQKMCNCVQKYIKYFFSLTEIENQIKKVLLGIFKFFSTKEYIFGFFIFQKKRKSNKHKENIKYFCIFSSLGTIKKYIFLIFRKSFLFIDYPKLK